MLDMNTYYYVTGELWYLVELAYRRNNKFSLASYACGTNKHIQQEFKDYYKKTYGLYIY